MNVLFVSGSYCPNVDGKYGFVQRLALQLLKNGHTVSVMVPSDSIKRSYKDTAGIKVHGVPFLNVPNFPSMRVPIPFIYRSHVKGLLSDLKPDIIHLQDHFSLASAVADANRHFDIPMVGTNHFMPQASAFPIPLLNRLDRAWEGGWAGHPEGLGGLDMAAATNFSWAMATGINRQVDRWMWSGFSKLFDRLAFVTATTKKAADLIGPMLRVEVLHVPDGVDLSVFCPCRESRSAAMVQAVGGRPILLHVGSLHQRAGLELFIQAVAVVSEMMGICLVIAGEGEARTSLELLAAKLGMTDRVLFKGAVPDIELPTLYRSAHCFISAGSQDFPDLTATMEAMACGLPVIAMEASGMDEQVTYGVNGFLYKKGELGTLVEAILSIFKQNGPAKRMGMAGAETMRRHSIERIAGVYETIYEGVIEGG